MNYKRAIIFLIGYVTILCSVFTYSISIPISLLCASIGVFLPIFIKKEMVVKE